MAAQVKRCCKCHKELTNFVVCRNCGHAICACKICGAKKGDK